jgi:DNA-binding transcriptional ArsR family regulator
VWALELLLHLKRTRERAWAAEELVDVLRGSPLIVSQSLDWLMRAGLVSIDERGCARYQPVSAELEQLVDAAAELYARKPETVRRIIVTAGHPGLANFADAFRLWKD